MPTRFEPAVRPRTGNAAIRCDLGTPQSLCKGGYVSNDSPQPTRTPSQIEADLGATRDRLTASVEALIDQVHPNRIKQRQIAGVKRIVGIELETAKLLIFNARGDLRTERLALIGGAAAGFVGFLVIVRAI